MFKAIECGGTKQPPPSGCKSADLEISSLALKYILGKCHVTSYRSLEWTLEAALQFQHCVVSWPDHPAHRSFWFCCPCPAVHYRGQSVPGHRPNAWRTQTVTAIYKSRGSIWNRELLSDWLETCNILPARLVQNLEQLDFFNLSVACDTLTWTAPLMFSSAVLALCHARAE